MKPVTVKIRHFKQMARGLNADYSVSHDGRKIKIVRKGAVLGYKMDTPMWDLREAVIKKLGIQMDGMGRMKVSAGFTQATRKRSFKGMTFAQIRKAQQKYGVV